MKAPWFPLYTGDFLASPDVQLMEAHEVGAYLLLLMHSWQSDAPGLLPDDDNRLRRLCRLSAAQWAESRATLLAKWPLEATGQRHNPRLCQEADKQMARRDRLAANGAKGGRPPQNQTVRKTEPKNNLQVSADNLQVSETKPTGLLSQPQPQSTIVDDVAREASSSPGLSAGLQSRLATLPDTSGEVMAEAGPLGKPARFKALCDALRLGPIDHEHYRTMGLHLAQGKPVRTATQWESWIAKFFTNQKQGGPLLQAQTVQLSTPTPAHELPPPGKETRGQVIVIPGIGSDASMNRMKLDSARKKWPTAIVHAFIPGRHD